MLSRACCASATALPSSCCLSGAHLPGRFSGAHLLAASVSTTAAVMFSPRRRQACAH